MPSERTKQLVDDVIEAVKANRAKLETCPAPRHEFISETGKLFSKWTCAHCGGRVDGSAAHWYNLGLEHAKQ